MVKLLTNILNVIPGLGLGDLIKILLGNAIPLGKLIPTGYINPKIMNCNINGAENGFAITGNERVGGGFGDAIGGSITTVSINNLASTEGNNLVGGFIGLSGPGDLAGADGGLTVNLLGLNYILKLHIMQK